MSMWDYNEEGDPYPPNDSRQYRNPYASHSDSSDYHGGYAGHQSHSGHNHSHDGHHGHDHVEHDNPYSYHGQRSEGSSSRQNYGSRHESYAGHGDHQGHRHASHGNYGHDHGHESYVSPSHSSNNIQSSITQSTHHGRGQQNYDMSVGYEIRQEHQPPPPISSGHGHEVGNRDLFTSDSVVNLTLDEIDALARTHRSRSWLVVLYAPWCRFCQAMEPNFERVAHHLEQSNVYVGRFRADGDYKEYAKRYLQLEHFPTVLFFPKNSSNIVKYQSENREVDALLGFVHAFE
ncbi:hypothetical protein KC19_11G165100 [Ceratodon purpureus]|uniref:Thioredoxin domain-containing protein n=1 Tax=Ceratodon purpureus TaxID=3225 RepID=A0A8T0GH17_CERPU|nr:hypothetical protein KC19_11G165100 [Ceratodon purpureus]